MIELESAIGDRLKIQAATKALEEYDKLIIESLEKKGLSGKDIALALFSDITRKQMVSSIVDMHQNSTQVCFVVKASEVVS